MKTCRQSFLLWSATFIHCAASRTDPFSSFGLLGSYFGVPGQNATYDYVIIGGGTAGLTVANRLTADPSVSVAVIEAGDFYEFANGNNSQVPAYASTFTGSNPVTKNTLLDWYMYTEPQKVGRETQSGSSQGHPVKLMRHQALNGQTLLFDSGKVIGGSSGRNFLWYIRYIHGLLPATCSRGTLMPGRGTVGAFDKWAKEVSDESYKFSSLLPFFQRSIHYHIPDNSKRPANASLQYNASDWSTSGGPIQVGYASWVNPITSWLAKAFSELGLEELKSFGSGKLLGWSYIPQELDQETQMRSSAAEFFHESISQGRRIRLYKATLAKKILFDGTIARGVRVESGGMIYQIMASREIILSAGVVCTWALYRWEC